MRKNRFSFIIHSAFILFTLALLINTSCVKKTPPEHRICLITFTEGDVHVSRQNKTLIPAKAGDKLFEKDTIICGEKSMATVQIGDTCIIKILENTSINLVQLFSRQTGLINLEKGQVLSKIEKLKRGERFSVKSPIMLASVRGTEFSSSYDPIDKTGSLAVKQGKVAISLKKDETEGINEKDFIEKAEVDKGNTAVVTFIGTDESRAEIDEPSTSPTDDIKDTKGRVDEKKHTATLKKTSGAEFIIRPITKKEEITISKVSIVKLIPEPEKQTPEKLIQINAPIIEEEKKIDIDIKLETEKELIQEQQAQKIPAKTTLENIKKTFNRIDEITLFNNRVIKGAIISRGKIYRVRTTSGIIQINQDDIMNIEVSR